MPRLWSFGGGMTRREFITLIGGAATGWPFAAHAEKQAIATVGYLSSKDEKSEAGIIAGVCKGLADQGFIEGLGRLLHGLLAQSGHPMTGVCL